MWVVFRPPLIHRKTIYQHTHDDNDDGDDDNDDDDDDDDDDSSAHLVTIQDKVY